MHLHIRIEILHHLFSPTKAGPNGTKRRPAFQKPLEWIIDLYKRWALHLALRVAPFSEFAATSRATAQLHPTIMKTILIMCTFLAFAAITVNAMCTTGSVCTDRVHFQDPATGVYYCCDEGEHPLTVNTPRSGIICECSQAK
ncbi:hypothetical protein RRG08_060405 [Elysia crispata]|uniref:Uncharacterized protein n=1 Tax=Elysia crispata TaxID=231223 RepID=A0AAE1ANB3_9GAST|nr:hypothetical protein RRG08_060405 [Elysia crispata]